MLFILTKQKPTGRVATQMRTKTLVLLITFFALSYIASKHAMIASGPIVDRGSHGNDISWPQCDGQVIKNLPKKAAFGIVGVTGGMAFTENPCVEDQFKWAISTGSASVYINVHAPNDFFAEEGEKGRFGKCKEEDLSCRAKNYGYETAVHAYEYAKEKNVKNPKIWWLDVEELNTWTHDQILNRRIIDGAVQFYKDKNLKVGVYSTPLMWRDITGDYKNGLPAWPAIIVDNPKDHCGKGFTGGETYLVQYDQNELDKNIACKSI